MTRWYSLPWLLSLNLLLCIPGVAADASESVRVGRYTTLAAVPTKAQRDPLQKLVQLDFPQQVHTVGDGLRHLLRGSGYRLAPAYASDPAMTAVLPRPLPEVHRRLGPMTLQAALTTVVGPVFRLVVDPLHGLVSFETLERYKPLRAPHTNQR